MYLSADDARSDFFLAAAAYVIGPTLFGLLLDAVPALQRSTLIATALAIAIPFLTIAAMPLFLMRYREGSFAPLRTGGGRGLLIGLGLGGVVAGAVLVGEVVGGGDVAGLTGVLPARAVLGLAVRWASVAVLAVFLHLRAEYAFRPVSEHQATLVRQAGLACAGTVVVSSALLLLAGRPAASLVPAAGVAGLHLLAERVLPQSGVGERWWVWAPVITLALGPLEIFGIFFGGSGFLVSAQQAGVIALVGLVAVMGRHRGLGAAVAFGLAAALLVADVLSLAGGTAFVI